MIAGARLCVWGATPKSLGGQQTAHCLAALPLSTRPCSHGGGIGSRESPPPQLPAGLLPLTFHVHSVGPEGGNRPGVGGGPIRGEGVENGSKGEVVDAARPHRVPALEWGVGGG